MTNHKLPHNHKQGIKSILEKMPNTQHFLEAAAIFQQLSDGTRLRIFWLLCHSEECGINIATAVGMSNAVVSHHLKSLKLHGLIISRRAGKEIYYSLANTEAAQLIHRIVDDYFQLSCPTSELTNHNLL